MRQYSRRIIFALAFVVMVLPSVAQQFRFVVDDVDGIPPPVYAERRERLLDSLPPHSVAIILSADIRNRQNDVDYEYRQNSDMLYLTGFPFPHCALLLCKDSISFFGIKTRQVFLVRTRKSEREQWQGVTAGPDEAETQYGLTPTFPYDSLTAVLDVVFNHGVAETGNDHQRGDEHTSASTSTPDLYVSGWTTRYVPLPLLGTNHYVDSEIKAGLRTKYGINNVVSPIPALISMRTIKDTAELRLMQKAVDITIEGHLESMRAAPTATHEYQIEAVMEYAFKRLGAEDVGYPSIVGSSYNACVLHYTANRRLMNTGNLVLADCGAEYHGYTADVTRTYPINGTFTPDQRAIYNLVLEAQDSGIAACRANAPFKNPHNAALSVIRRGLLDLGIINDGADVKKYFMHGTSHYLGLDVHDVGHRGPLEPNTVITVEPGIYIAEGSPCDKRWWNIGVRIEDDILVTTGDPVNMSARLPRTIADVEEVVNVRSK